MSERLPDDDDTLEDGLSCLDRPALAQHPHRIRPDDETIAADPRRLTEADLADASSQGLPDDDTIDVDPELLRRVAASADRGAHHGDETVVRDPESLREAQAVTAASHAAPQESRRRRWKLVALAIPIVLVGALAALAASQGWFGNGRGATLRRPQGRTTTSRRSKSARPPQ